jgi:hypothetical protein
MKILASLLILIALTLASGVPAASAKDPVRLDGTTDVAFEASFAKLVRSLKAPERRSLALRLFGTLLKHECLAPETVVRLTFMPVEPKDGQLIQPCREHLNGMSYPDILQAAEPPAKEPVAELPNNSSKPTPLRGAA